MKFPTHILLDVKQSNFNSYTQYWVLKFFLTDQNNINTFNTFTSHYSFLLKKEQIFKNNLLLNQKKFTIKYNYTNPALFTYPNINNFFKLLLVPHYKIKHRATNFNSTANSIYNSFFEKKKKFNEKKIIYFLKNFKNHDSGLNFKSTSLWTLFDINFLRKEKIYTKLKYSRVPQYDIVSGGVAALFAGFLGFLISEKFGFELVDSGDFFILFMYFVFLSFFFRLFLKTINTENLTWNILSHKWLITYIITLFYLFINYFKNLLNK